jgi:xanthine dehydrogenase YagR molybdenum-binding subunit
MSQEADSLTKNVRLRLGFADQLREVTVTTPKDEPRPWDADSALTVVGQPTPRVDGSLKTSGAAVYTHDVRLPGMLYAAILRSPHACATLEHLDVAAAMAQPGVVAAVPLAKVGDRLRFAGHDVAALAARSRHEARAALSAISVRYRPEPFVVDTLEAMQPGAPQVHAAAVNERRTEGDEPGEASGGAARGNVRLGPSQSKGDYKKGLRQAKVTHSATYTTQVHTHSALETHSLVVRWEDPRRMTVWCSTQGIFSVRDEMAEIFGLKPADVRVITEHLGGGFGAKFGASAPGSRLGYAAGELARRAGAPVSLCLDRREEQLCTGNRPDSIQQVTLGAGADGALTAIHVVAHGSGGIATGAGVGRSAFGVYSRCPNIKVESHDVFTNAGPSTGVSRARAPAGGVRDRAGDRRAGAEDGARSAGAAGWPTWSTRCAAISSSWGESAFSGPRGARRRRRGGLVARGIRHGVGVACSIWGDYGRAKAAVVTVSVGRDGAIFVRNGAQDLGTGIRTVLGQVVAEVLGRPLAEVTVLIGGQRAGAVGRQRGARRRPRRWRPRPATRRRWCARSSRSWRRGCSLGRFQSCPGGQMGARARGGDRCPLESCARRSRGRRWSRALRGRRPTARTRCATQAVTTIRSRGCSSPRWSSTRGRGSCGRRRSWRSMSAGGRITR